MEHKTTEEIDAYLVESAKRRCSCGAPDCAYLMTADAYLPPITPVDVPLLRKAVEWVETQDALRQEGKDSEWYQGDWIDSTGCGTTFCVAGYVGQLLNPGYRTSTTVNNIHVSGYAAAHLGLTSDQATWLFAGSNDAAEVRAIACEIAGEEL